MEQEILWSENCIDPGSRVFFIGHRVFRAYDKKRASEALEFLNSDCYRLLSQKEYIVHTWVASDISIEGYSLILEHEFLECLPEKWFPIAQLQDILLFHSKINQLCSTYGFGLRDIVLGNVTLKNGHLCFVDFGSFVNQESIDRVLYSQYCLPLAYLPVAIYLRNDGYDYVANSLISDYAKWKANKSEPSGDTLIDKGLHKYLEPIISYYDIYFKQANWHIRIYTSFSLSFVRFLNHIASIIFRKQPNYWEFIKVKNVYSEQKMRKVLLNKPSIHKGTHYYPLYPQTILSLVPRLSQNHMMPITRIVLWGNFEWNEIKELQQQVKASITIMTIDRIYADDIYRKIKDTHASKILIACCNVIRGNGYRELSTLRCDLLIMQNEIYLQEHLGLCTNWPEKTSHMCQWILTYRINEEERLKTSMSSIWNRIWTDNCFELYSKK